MTFDPAAKNPYALAPHQVASAAVAPLRSTMSGAEMTASLTAYRELQAAIDRAMPDQILSLDGKQYRRKGYWRALAVAFNLSVELVSERREGDVEYVYLVMYSATTPNGRSAIGDGACSKAEKDRGRMRVTEHNVRSHAHTRAFNRAVSNLVGFGEVSAEEVAPKRDDPVGFTASTKTSTSVTAPPTLGASDVSQTVEIGVVREVKASGSGYLVTLETGIIAGTANPPFVAMAQEAEKSHWPVTLTLAAPKPGRAPRILAIEKQDFGSPFAGEGRD